MDALSKEFVRMVKQSGWRQREVARQLELTEGAVSHIMTGRNRPNPNRGEIVPPGAHRGRGDGIGREALILSRLLAGKSYSQSAEFSKTPIFNVKGCQNLF